MSTRLSTMPTGIAGMYELMLCRLFDDSKRTHGPSYSQLMLRMRKRILLWISMERSPQSILNVQYACVTVDETSFDPDTIPPPPKSQVLGVCGSLVEIGTNDGLECFRFSHRTVREFLLSPPDQLSPDGQKHPDQAVTFCMIPCTIEAEASMALICRKSIYHLVICSVLEICPNPIPNHQYVSTPPWLIITFHSNAALVQQPQPH